MKIKVKPKNKIESKGSKILKVFSDAFHFKKSNKDKKISDFSFIINKKFPKLYDHDSIKKGIKILTSVPESGLPVFDKTNKIIGEITQREFLRNLIGKNLDLGGVGFENLKTYITSDDKTIKHFINKKEIIISEDYSIKDIISLIYEENITCLPVYDKNKKFLGIITEISILKNYSKLLNKLK